MNDELQKQKELQEARERDKRRKARETLKKYSTGKNRGLAQDTIGNAKNLAKIGTPWGLWGLASQVSLADIVYVIALIAAIFKDILDLISATGILYIIVVVMTFLTTIVIASMMLLGSFSSGVGGAQQKIIRSWLVLLSGTTAELIFGINFLPIETLTVLIIYGLALSARKEAREANKEKRRSAAIEQEAYA